VRSPPFTVCLFDEEVQEDVGRKMILLNLDQQNLTTCERIYTSGS